MKIQEILNESKTPIGLPAATEEQYENPTRGVAYETESGFYGVTKDGKHILFDNSGYKQKFTTAEFKKGLKQGWLIDADMRADMEEDGMTPEEMKEYAWKVTKSEISNPDEEHWFDLDILKKIL